MEEERKRLRRAAIAARDTLPPEVREAYSAQAAERLVRSEVFRTAQTVLLYTHTRGELSLDALRDHPLAAGKRLVYPRCTGPGEMIALLPENEEAWETGRFDIREPIAERSMLISPAEIDLVVCPCTAFDAAGHRLGMGGGYYDRFLPRCTRAVICAVAFEAQKAPAVPTEPWDVPMSLIFTEKETYACLSCGNLCR